MDTLPIVKPVIVKTKKKPFDNPDWIFEWKYDGFRGVLHHAGDRCMLISKQGKRLDFRELEYALGKILGKNRVILDGEVVSFDKNRRPVFKDLVKRQGNINYVAFDILYLNGKDLRGETLEVRKKILEKFCKGKIMMGLYSREHGIHLFNLMKKHDLEGMVAKPIRSLYGSRAEWYKVKNPDYSQEAWKRKAFSRKNRREEEH